MNPIEIHRGSKEIFIYVKSNDPNIHYQELKLTITEAVKLMEMLQEELTCQDQ